MHAGSPYQALVLEHHRHPRNFGTLPHFTHAADGANLLCGDRLRIELDCREGRIGALRFRGESCAIAIASASMMSELVIGSDLAAVAALEARLCALLAGAADADPGLGAAGALAVLRHHVTRRKCALLPWATLRAALSGASVATTEGVAGAR